MTAPVEEYTYKTVRLARWDFETPVAHVGTQQYFPVRHFCKRLHIDSRTQISGIKGDARFDGALKEIPFKTEAGWRPTMWLRRDKLALWLLGIDAKRCALGSTADIQAFQEDVLHAADALLFGAASHAAPEDKGIVSATVHAEFIVNCLDCGAPHFIVYENGQITVVRMRDED
jgi:hypothetical protein